MAFFLTIMALLVILTPVFSIVVNRYNAKRKFASKNGSFSNATISKSLQISLDKKVQKTVKEQSKMDNESASMLTRIKSTKTLGETEIASSNFNALLEGLETSKSSSVVKDSSWAKPSYKNWIESFDSFNEPKTYSESLSNLERSDKAETSNGNESENVPQHPTERKMALLGAITNEEREHIDDSVIEVTNQSFDLRNIVDEAVAVPEWPHQYIYSYKAIQTANPEQLRFYEKFKNYFLEGRYLDVKGNYNYAFILLFDLIGAYNTHKSLELLSKQLTALGNHYPKTDSYATTFFQRIKTREREGAVAEVRTQPVANPLRYFPPSEPQEYWKLGSKYKNKLSLTKGQESLLNQLWSSSNSFSNIEYCNLEIIKLYLLTHATLDKQFEAEESSLSDQLAGIADLVARKQHRYRKGSANYNECIQTVLPQINNYLFKLCENQVREVFGHKRKLSADVNFTSSPVVVKAFETLVLERVEVITPELRNSIQNPDEKTEIELNGLNPGRWKADFEQYKNTFASKPEKFFEALLVLGNKNRKNTAVENLFYEGFKLMAGYHKEIALKLYILYVSHGLKAAGFVNKKISKGIQHQLFNSQQLKDFEEVVQRLLTDKDAGRAIQSVSDIFIMKRKIVKLDRDLIKEVIQKHADTVEVLDKVLNEEGEDPVTILTADAREPEALHKSLTEEIAPTNTPFLDRLNFNPVQSEVLLLFDKNNLTLLQKDLEAYCISQGLFKNQLIESINDSCFELLDDVFIEQDETAYTIDPSYYNKILTL
ncbi:tellurite resistance TerB C-terminal domain-containing protein [Dyadobacter psychrotolerans]|uniref:TerB-C domain-containing protein n=1 Tax=Dyadobacter psychrotolerans TaxID=2541721 RepID=A0A4R5DRU3_9BACT|nr:tellurite resistance TerB C-terminal domain-containing protein [Dyadobacter psychrotolerans]TDE14781.1 hypothetical protein E0F88_16475 [Dyadobacter psychrotolerans]